MNKLSIARAAISAEIKRLAADRSRLEAVLKTLGSDQASASALRPAKPAKGKRRLRLKDDVAADITNKVVKAVKAHREGASRKNILQYLARNGYEVGHHFNEPHLNKIVTTLLGGESPAIRREGDKGSARYFAA